MTRFSSMKNVDATNRKPMFLFRLFGSFLLRQAQRALSRLLFQEPPRNRGRFRAGPIAGDSAAEAPGHKPQSGRLAGAGMVGSG